VRRWKDTQDVTALRHNSISVTRIDGACRNGTETQFSTIK